MARFYEIFHKFDMQEYCREQREEGIKIGDYSRLINLIFIKHQKGMSLEMIASEVEEDTATVEEIIKVIETFEPEEFDAGKVYEELKKMPVFV